MKKYVTVAIPPKGRTARRMLYELYSHEYVKKEDSEMLSWILEADRRRIDVETKKIERGERERYSTIEEVRTSKIICPDDELKDVVDRKPEPLQKHKGLPGLEKLYRDNLMFHTLMVYPNLNRKGKPPRISLGCYETVIEDVPVLLVGADHYDAPWHVSSGRAELAVAGFDEIAATFAGDEKNRENTKRIKRWPGFNNSDVHCEPVVLGSAGLEDYCAHFIIAKYPELFKGIKFSEKRFKFYGLDSVFADQKYIPIYAHFIKRKSDGKGRAPPAEFRRSGKVEIDVKKNGKLGIGIGNTGAFIGREGLYVYGPPVMQSETLIITDKWKYDNDPDTQKVADALVHNQYTDEERIKSYVNWYKILEKNITPEKWIRMPSVVDMFVDDFDRNTWFRGYKAAWIFSTISSLYEV